MSCVFLVMLVLKQKNCRSIVMNGTILVFLGGQKSKSPQIFQDVGCGHLQLSPTRFVKAI